MSKVSPVNTLCPCGSSLAYSACCGRYHAGLAAPDAERLMRSRYSAYVFQFTDYLLATWHLTTRPAQLDLSDSPKWLGLQVIAHQPDGERASVEFIARYKIGGRAHRMHELSHFVFEDGRWYYLNGQTPQTNNPSGETLR